jgi:mRNA interferase RelE/StbE
MAFQLEFNKQAFKEWQKLSPEVRELLKTKLAERLIQPRVPSARISGGRDLYKIKLRQMGYRLVYQVKDQTITVTVLAVGKRERNAVYQTALTRV